MTWKAIGQSITGTAHHATGRGCEDAIAYAVVPGAEGTATLICAISDGAGSASHAAWAANYATQEAVAELAGIAASGGEVTETTILSLAENLYAGLLAEATLQGVGLDEYSCTWLGCYVAADNAVFFQIGDGAIVRDDGTGYYSPVWWPQNGEYHNTTTFLVDDPNMGNLQILVTSTLPGAVALFTDGLQLLALNLEHQNAHQPFFSSLIGHLQQATSEQDIAVLNEKLAAYLDSRTINDRTDDDKTLFLATKWAP